MNYGFTLHVLYAMYYCCAIALVDVTFPQGKGTTSRYYVILLNIQHTYTIQGKVSLNLQYTCEGCYMVIL